MVASAIFTMLTAGVITSHLFGLKMLGISQTVVGGTDASRRAIGLLMADIRAAKTLKVGQGSASTFTEVSAYTLQQGSAIQLYTNSSANSYIRYYLDSSGTNLMRLATGETTPTLVAPCLSTNNVFTCEDYLGNVTSNRQCGFVVGVNLQFAQLGSPPVVFGSNSSLYYYNSFALQIKVCSRSPD
jgi:hypothetical protein